MQHRAFRQQPQPHVVSRAGTGSGTTALWLRKEPTRTHGLFRKRAVRCWDKTLRHNDTENGALADLPTCACYAVIGPGQKSFW
jgi:hypothetical protein